MSSKLYTDDKKFMQRAIALAQLGIGKTSPNPAVGAVLVENGHILAEGWHHGAGLPHAEIEALQQVRHRNLQKATLYITLEPCSTHGRTPPCTEAIIAAKVRRVVWGATDPHSVHAGRAEGILKHAGISVTHGILEKECGNLNEAWNHWIQTRMPFVIAKWGMSLDGQIATAPGTSPWITHREARQDAMRLRASVDAILVGAETVRKDNPRLTIRLPGKHRQPWRVVMTRTGNLPTSAHLFTDAHRDKTWVFQKKSLRSVLKELGKRQVTSVMIEGGGKLLGSAFDAGLVHRVQFYVAPIILGGDTPAVGGKGIAHWQDASTLKDVIYTQLGNNLKVTGRIDSSNTKHRKI